MSKRIALFGGSFDPIHLGHTAVAADAALRIDADKVIFVPAKRSPLKAFFPQASDTDRCEMISLAVADNPHFELSDYELKKNGPNYTLETVRYFKSRFDAGTSIFWLVGADSIDDLPLWFAVTDLIDECNLSLMYRAGFPTPDFAKYAKLWGNARIDKLRKNIIPTPLVDISSTEIRKRLAAGKDADDLLCPKVAQYIRSHDLYRNE